MAQAAATEEFNPERLSAAIRRLNELTALNALAEPLQLRKVFPIGKVHVAGLDIKDAVILDLCHHLTQLYELPILQLDKLPYGRHDIDRIVAVKHAAQAAFDRAMALGLKS